LGVAIIASVTIEREKMIGIRLRAFREMLQIPRASFAASVGCGSERIAAYEAGRARLPYWVFKAIADRYHLYPRWLAEETGSPQVKNSFKDSHFIASISRHALFTEVYDKFLSEQLLHEANTTAAAAQTVIEELTDLAAVLKELDTANLSPTARTRIRQFQSKYSQLASKARQELEIREAMHQRTTPVSGFGEKANSLNIADTEPVLPKLIARLKHATAAHGKKSELAEWLGVHRQMVTDWLSGKQEPGGEITLRMLQWVEEQEG
jgi:DNA-binding transcriptional regulator YiaG